MTMKQFLHSVTFMDADQNIFLFRTWPAIHFFILTAGRKVMIGPVKAGELFLQNFD